MVYNATFQAVDVAKVTSDGIVSALDLLVGISVLIALYFIFKYFTGKGIA